MGRGLLLFLIAICITFLLMLLSGCDQPREFYSIDKNCLIVEQDSSFHCYRTHEAYAVHEGYHIDHAKQRFNSYRLEAEKRASMRDSVKQKNVYNYPGERAEEDYIKQRIIEQRKQQNEDS